MTVSELLPFLIPLAIAERFCFSSPCCHILTHKNYKRGSRALWLVVTIVGLEFIGPVLYLLLGKEDN